MQKQPVHLLLRDFARLWLAYIGPYRAQAALLGGLIVLTLVIRLASPEIIRLFLQGIETNATIQHLLQIASLFIGVALFEQLLGVITTYFSEQVGWGATNQLRQALTLHCLKLDMGFHQKHAPGVMVERLDGDINTLGNFFSRLAFDLVSNILLFIGVLLLLTWRDWRIGFIVTVIAVVTLIALNLIRQRAEPHWKAVLQANAELYGFLEERFKGTEDIRANGATAYVLNGLYQLHQARMNKEYGTLPWKVAGLTLPTMALALATLTVFVVGYETSTLRVSAVFVLYYYVGLLNSPFWQIVNQIEALQLAGASIGRVKALQAVESKVVDNGRSYLPRTPLQIQLDNVSFQYETGEESVLSNISLVLEPEDVLGILGRTGSGKSTLVRLLVRQLEAQKGAVLLGNETVCHDIRELPLAHLRQQVGYITQDVQLFHATLRDNLTFFDKSIADPTLVQIIHEFGLSSWLQGMPNGLDTIIGSGGQGLSDGEGQLVAFLRVFLKDPQLVIFDEASSRLDSVTERLVTQATKQLLQSRTGVIVAHRLQTMQQANKILILEKGHIVEYGERVALENDPTSRLSAYLRMATITP